MGRNKIKADAPKKGANKVKGAKDRLKSMVANVNNSSTKVNKSPKKGVKRKVSEKLDEISNSPDSVNLSAKIDQLEQNKLWKIIAKGKAKEVPRSREDLAQAQAVAGTSMQDRSEGDPTEVIPDEQEDEELLDYEDDIDLDPHPMLNDGIMASIDEAPRSDDEEITEDEDMESDQEGNQVMQDIRNVHDERRPANPVQKNALLDQLLEQRLQEMTPEEIDNLLR